MPAKNTESKKMRREAALKQQKQKRAMIATVCGLVAVAVIITIALWPSPEVHVYAIGGSQVELSANGRFSATDPKGVGRSGTFTESYTDGVTTITFSYGNGRIATGQIVENVLTIPNDWVPVCGHRHSPDLPLVV